MLQVRWISITALIILSAFEVFIRCDTASAHIRLHQHKVSTNERTEDGAYSPLDSNHYMDGEHHQEFDHEAIIGIMTNVLFFND